MVNLTTEVNFAKKSYEKSSEKAKSIISEGIANRTIARHTLERFVQDLRNQGLEIIIDTGNRTPKYVIKFKDEIVAAGHFTSLVLYDEPKKMQRFISIDKIKTELSFAKDQHVPITLFVENRRNNTRWAYKIPFDTISNWNGESTPLALSKDDELSSQVCEEEFLNVIESIKITT